MGTLKTVIAWVFGIFFLLAGVMELTGSNITGGLAIFAAGLFTLPNTLKIIDNKTHNYLSKNKLNIIAAVVLFFFGIGLSSPTKDIQVPPEEKTPNEEIIEKEEKQPAIERGTVVAVSDGDTLRVQVNGEELKVRLIGIDTPETQHSSEPVQCYGPEAKKALTELVLNKDITMELDERNIDQYDRYLRYIWVDGILVNKYLVENGYAFAAEYKPNVKYQTEIENAENKAKENLIGLWAEETCKGNVYTGTYKDPKLEAPLGVTKKAHTVSNGAYYCDCEKTCSQMVSCEEAYFQLNTCGCAARDNDRDGVPCESIC